MSEDFLLNQYKRLIRGGLIITYQIVKEQRVQRDIRYKLTIYLLS